MKQLRSWVRDAYLCWWVLLYTLVVRLMRLLQTAERRWNRRHDAGTRRTRGASQRTNQKTALLCLFFLALCGATTACQRDPRLQAQERFERGLKWVEEGRLESALIELRRAVQLAPEHAGAHRELAKIHLQRRNPQEAVRELTLAVQADPEDWESRVLLSDLLVRAGRFARVQELLEPLEEKGPGDVGAMVILAESYRGQGDRKRAQQLVGAALEIEPHNVRAHFNQAALFLQVKKWSGAERSLRRAWEADRSSMVAPLALIDMLFSLGRTTRAEAVVQELLSLQLGGPQPHYAAAAFYLRQRRISEAEEQLRQVRTLGGTSPVFRGILAQFYVATEKKDLAEQEFQEILAENPEDWLNRLRRAEFYWREQRLQDARQDVETILQGRPKDWRALLLRGAIRIDQGDWENAILDLIQAREINDDSPAVHYQLARALVQKGTVETAERSLRQALSKNPDYVPAQLLLAELELRQGRVETVLQDLDELMRRRPALPQSYWLRSQAYVLRGEFRRAEQDLQQVLREMVSQEAERPLVLEALAWVKYRQRQYAAARRLLTEALSLSPSSRQALYLLGLCYVAEKKPDQAFEVVRAYVAKSPDQAAGHAVWGELAMRVGRGALAEQHLKKAIELNPKMSSAWAVLAENYVAQHQQELAVETYQSLTKRDKTNAFAFLRLGQLHESLGSLEQAESMYRTSIELAPRNPVAKNNLAWLYAEHGGNIDVALRLAQEARELAPEDPRVSDTLAWIYSKKGIYRTAIDYLGESLKKNPENPVYHYHLGVAYHGAGRSAEAKTSLKHALSLQPDFTGSERARQLLAELASNQ